MNRTHRSVVASVVSLGVAGMVFGAPGAAWAERRRNSLEEEPAVRARMLLVKNRFEFAPLFESTINAEYRHILGGGLKLEYHLSDMWSFGAVGVYSISLDTGLVDKINTSLEDNPMNMREPSHDEFNAHLNDMPIHGAAFVSFTPWYGKLAAFSRAFLSFDFYFQAGVSFAQLKSQCDAALCSDNHPGEVFDPDGPDGMMAPIPPDFDPNNDPPLNDGNRVGLYLGGGIHVFVTEFLALDFTVRDYAFGDNPSGADFNADLAVTSDDSRFLHHLFFGFGLSLMLPPSAKRTR